MNPFDSPVGVLSQKRFLLGDFFERWYVGLVAGVPRHHTKVSEKAGSLCALDRGAVEARTEFLLSEPQVRGPKRKRDEQLEGRVC
ncbi:MAG: hypothetical protein FJZ87_11185 [Chloroflexi bacterium]|nr:hypothetical protein [Chloroflexota bacterium]